MKSLRVGVMEDLDVIRALQVTLRTLIILGRTLYIYHGISDVPSEHIIAAL
jgi:hypothetical protein